METSLYQETEPDKKQELKKSMFLDFASGNTKQQKFASLLASPDLSMLKMASPELEKMLLASNGLLQTPTPTQFIYPKYVTDEQEAYARGFVEALAQLHGGMPGQGSQAMPGPPSTGVHDPKHASISISTALTNAQTDDLPPTYSQLMPMSSATALSVSSSLSASTAAATTLANMSVGANSIAIPKRHQYVPSGLAMPTRLPFSTIPSTSLGFAPSTTVQALDIQVKDEPSLNTSDHTDHTVPTSLQSSPTPSSSRLSDSPVLSPSSTINMDNDGGNLPIDMNNQEVIKVERKRARNRIAARKCRTRKLERISRLEEKVNDLKTKNNELLQHATSLNDQVVQLKQQIMDHMKTGCQIMMPNIQAS